MVIIPTILNDGPTNYYPLDDGGAGTTIANAANVAKPMTCNAGALNNSVDRRIGKHLFQSAYDTTMSVSGDTTGYCWEAYFMAPVVSQTNKGILGSWDTNGTMIYSGNSIATMNWYHGSSSFSVNMTSLWPNNTWVHLANLWNGTTQYAIVNGVVAGTRTISTSPGVPANRYSVGYYNFDSPTVFPNLHTAHFAYWSGAAMAANPMTVAKILTHYQALLHQFTPFKWGNLSLN